ncbi:MAG TPA: hypothetical protein PL001_07980, partial [Candidatus Kryptobacter bacterium]|nr:hypothetical protein [Candidatus Kryptobacter bacterium]
QSGLLRMTGLFIRLFPLRKVQKMAASVGRFAYRHMRIRSKVALTNLKLCFPEKGNAELDNLLEGAYVNIATVLFEFLYFPKFTPDNLRDFVEFTADSRALIETGFSKGRGLVMMSGHFSNWELIALAIGASFPGKIQIIVHPFHNKAVDRLADSYRRHLGNSTVPMANSIRAALTWLKSNGIVALLADQSAAKESAPARFFGIEVPTFQGPSSFALRTRAEMLAGFLIRRENGTYLVDLRRIEYSDLKDESEESVSELTQRHVAMLEDVIRKHPTDWLWFHRRFKHTPEYQKAIEETGA